jgi:hypothetical protein
VSRLCSHTAVAAGPGFLRARAVPTSPLEEVTRMRLDSGNWG